MVFYLVRLNSFLHVDSKDIITSVSYIINLIRDADIIYK